MRVHSTDTNTFIKECPSEKQINFKVKRHKILSHFSLRLSLQVSPTAAAEASVTDFRESHPSFL